MYVQQIWTGGADQFNQSSSAPVSCREATLLHNDVNLEARREVGMWNDEPGESE